LVQIKDIKIKLPQLRTKYKNKTRIKNTYQKKNIEIIGLLVIATPNAT